MTGCVVFKRLQKSTKTEEKTNCTSKISSTYVDTLRRGIVHLCLQWPSHQLPSTTNFVRLFFIPDNFVICGITLFKNELQSTQNSEQTQGYHHVCNSPRSRHCSSWPSKAQAQGTHVPICFWQGKNEKKRSDERVCDVFLGERYHGEVDRVIFHEVYAQYMYRVVFEDGDMVTHRIIGVTS